MLATPEAPPRPPGEPGSSDWEHLLGAVDLLCAEAEIIEPKERLTPLQFGTEHRTYTKEGKEDRWRPEDTPWAAEILETLDEDSPFRRIVAPKGTQLGFTELGLIWAGQGIMQSQSLLMILPTEAIAKRVVKTKFRPMLKTTTVLTGAFPGRSVDTSLHFSNDALDLMFAGSNSPSNFASITVARAMGDEVDRWSEELKKEGDPVDLLENRIAEYGFLGKMFLPSSPTVEGASIVWREWLQSDQRIFECPCPSCGVLQQWLWENMRWEAGSPETTKLRCVACETESTEAAWKSIWGDGAWRATVANPLRKDTAGFHLSTLYARLGQRSWAQLAQQFEAVVASGLSSRMQVFVNTILGLPWKVSEETVAVDELRQRLDDSMEKGVVPAGGLVLTAGVDYQKNRLEVFVWAWARKRERWLVDKVVVPRLDAEGKMRAAEAIANDLKAMALDRAWPHELGGNLRVEFAIHDAGDRPSDVYDVLEFLPASRNCASKGFEGWGKQIHFSAPKIIDVHRDGKVVKTGRLQMSIYTAEAKRAWYDDLRRPMAAEGPSERYVHLPTWVDEEEGLLAGFVSEELRKSTRGKLKWDKVVERNEPLDCAIMGEGARWQLKTHRWKEEDWKRREALVNTRTPPPAPQKPQEAQPRPQGRGGDWLKTDRNWLG
ncbi:terminase gpA endonuclease subunit [Caulobacter sp. CCNWLY153]|uniref:terminase gpA endonuclease subunit n=1 Tax=unclassified Caulobacter TaxID=2648921 RepID=UPI002FF337B3